MILGVLLTAASAFAQYVPSGVHLNRSNSKVEDLEWEKAKRTQTVESIQSYVSRFPKSRHVKAAERLLERLDAGERSRSLEDGPGYTLVPQSKHVVRAIPAEQKRK
jgi:hypothetical protein